MAMSAAVNALPSPTFLSAKVAARARLGEDVAGDAVVREHDGCGCRAVVDLIDAIAVTVNERGVMFAVVVAVALARK